MDNYILAYYQQIHEGTVTVGRWVRLLYEKIVTGIDSGEYIFDQRKANRAINFIEKFVKHNKGPLAPGPLILSLWQKAALSILYGIVDENGFRVFREIFLVVGRKCGKTLLASGVMAYESFADGEFGSEIYCVAPKLDQSELVYSAWEFTKDSNPEFSKRTKKRKTDYFIPSRNATLKKISFNEKKADGYSPMLVVADELASWPAARGMKQYEVLVSGTGARNEPIIFSISSSGYVNEGIYDELFKRGTRFLLGDSREKRLLPILYTIDDIGKWDDINELRKSLPGLGTSVSTQFILDQIDIAHESLSKQSEFICKMANIKQSSSNAWLPTQTVESACGEPLRLEDFKSSYCVIGIDLSQVRDLTACVAIIERGGELYVFAQFFLPREKLQDAIQRDGVPYNHYVTRGFLTLSGDNFVDYHDCFDWIMRLITEYEILPLKIGYDRYSAQYLIQSLVQAGAHCDDVWQGENLYGVIQETEALLEDGKIHIGDNDLLKMHLLNGAIKMSTERGRGKLVKLNPSLHIDGAAALLDAMTVRQKWYGEIGERLANEVTE